MIHIDRMSFPHPFLPHSDKFALLLLAAGAWCFMPLTPSAQAQDSAAEKTAPAAQPGAATDTIVIVNGDKISQLEIDQLFNARFQERMNQLPAERIEQLRKKMRPVLVDEVVSKRLFLKEAEQRNIEAKPEDIKKTYDQFRSGFKTEQQFNDYLKLIDRTPEKVRREISDEKKIQLLLQKELAGMKVPETAELEKELQEIYSTFKERFVIPEKVKARHILFSEHRKSDAVALHKKLSQNDDLSFSEEARKHSDCPSKKEGGSLGEFKRGEMVPEFEKAAFSQKVGEIGPIIKTEFGYHIVQVQSRSAREKISFNEAKGGMAAEYVRNLQKEATAKFIDSLTAKANIEWLDKSAMPRGK